MRFNELSFRDRAGTGTSHGTFGEFLQGILPSEDNFLVTFPIDKYSTCLFYSLPHENELTIYPIEKNKSLLLAKKLLKHYNKPIGGHLHLESELTPGKGLASSTADMIATARALEDYFKFTIPVEILEKFIRELEPADGIMHPGVVVYDHKKLELKNELGECPALTILAIDEGGIIDTVQFNKIPKPFSQEDKTEYKMLLGSITEAFRNQDLELLGKVTTRSAILNQKLRNKKTLNTMLEISKSIGGLGIVTAHSGTYIGIIISEHDPYYFEKVELGLFKLRQLKYPVQQFHSISRLEKKKEITI